MSSKTCKKCGELKSTDNYYITKQKVSFNIPTIYYRSTCKQCMTAPPKTGLGKLLNDTQKQALLAANWTAKSKDIYVTCGINTAMGLQSWYRYMRNGAVAEWRRSASVAGCADKLLVPVDPQVIEN